MEEVEQGARETGEGERCWGFGVQGERRVEVEAEGGERGCHGVGWGLGVGFLGQRPVGWGGRMGGG